MIEIEYIPRSDNYSPSQVERFNKYGYHGLKQKALINEKMISSIEHFTLEFMKYGVKFLSVPTLKIKMNDGSVYSIEDMPFEEFRMKYMLNEGVDL